MLLSPLVHSLEKATQSRYHFRALLNIVKWESSSLYGCVNIFTNTNSKEFGLCVCMYVHRASLLFPLQLWHSGFRKHSVKCIYEAILVHSSQEGIFHLLYQALLLQTVEMRNLLSNAALIYPILETRAQLAYLCDEHPTRNDCTWMLLTIVNNKCYCCSRKHIPISRISHGPQGHSHWLT